MTTEQVRVGAALKHTIHGNCVVVNQNRNGFWVQVWRGICGDKLYTFKGISAKDLSPRAKTCSGR